MKEVKWVERVVVTVLGSGYSPIAPATVGSAVTCLIFAVLPASFHTPWPAAVAIIPVFLAGVWLSGRAIRNLDIPSNQRFAKLRRPNPTKSDPDYDVFDEFVGQWVALLGAPHTVVGFVATFVIFRVFDILKPFGIGTLERIGGGWGIMLDDLLAGIYSALVLSIGFRVAHFW